MALRLDNFIEGAANEAGVKPLTVQFTTAPTAAELPPSWAGQAVEFPGGLPQVIEQAEAMDPNDRIMCILASQQKGNAPVTVQKLNPLRGDVY